MQIIEVDLILNKKLIINYDTIRKKYVKIVKLLLIAGFQPQESMKS